MNRQNYPVFSLKMSRGEATRLFALENVARRSNTVICAQAVALHGTEYPETA